MEKKRKYRKIGEEDFASLNRAIEVAKKGKALDNVELVEDLVEKLKGKDISAVLDIIITLTLLLNPMEAQCMVNMVKKAMNLAVESQISSN